MTNWNPMKNAPRDGTFVILDCPDNVPDWQVCIGRFESYDELDEEGNPTGSWWPLGEENEGLESEPVGWLPCPVSSGATKEPTP